MAHSIVHRLFVQLLSFYVIDGLICVIFAYGTVVVASNYRSVPRIRIILLSRRLLPNLYSSVAVEVILGVSHVCVVHLLLLV